MHTEADRGQIELILGRIDALPTLSPVAARLLAAGSAEEVDIDEVVGLIESDPALTATLLGLCRRSTTGLGGTVETVKRAVVLLGFESVRTAALSAMVFEHMQEQAELADRVPREPGEPSIDRVGMWKHAAAVACAAEMLAEDHPEIGVAPEHAFVAGLLHDLGRVALESILPRACGRIAAIAERRVSDSAPVERRVLGIDHHAAGARLAERWRLPGFVRDVIEQHGRGVDAVCATEHRSLLGLVNVAKAQCRSRHLGWSGDFGPPPDPALWAREVGLPEELREGQLTRLLESIGQRWKALGLDEPTTPEMLASAVSAANRRLASMTRVLLERSTLADERGRALHAIGAFQSAWRPGEGVPETLERVVRSAAGLLGEGFWAMVHEPAGDGRWTVSVYGRAGRLRETHTVERPGSRLAPVSLGELVGHENAPVSAMTALPWLSDYAAGAPDLRRVRVVPLWPAQTDAPCAALLHDHGPDALRGPTWAALRGAWGAAVRSADETERARQERERHAETARALDEARARLEATATAAMLGEVTAGAVQEIAQPLEVARARSKRLVMRSGDEQIAADGRAIGVACERIDALVCSLRLLAEPPEPEFAAVEPDDVVAEGVEIAQNSSERVRSSRLDIREPEGSLTMWGDRGLLAASLAELIQNAAEAGQGVSIEIAAERDPLDGRVLLSVRDTGLGLSERARRHAFDPFFSDTPGGRRTGLGLSRARRLLGLLGSELTLTSPQGGGTLATIAVPPAPEQGGAAPGPTPDGAQRAA